MLTRATTCLGAWFAASSLYKTFGATGSAMNAKLNKRKMKNPPKIQVAIAILSIIALALGYILDKE